MEGCWISLVNPTDGEVAATAERYGVDIDALKSALDTDERSRIETDDNFTMILVNIPTIETHNDKELYDTIPLSIFLLKKAVITVCLEETPILKGFVTGAVRSFDPAMKSALCFRFCTAPHRCFCNICVSLTDRAIRWRISCISLLRTES